MKKNTILIIILCAASFNACKHDVSDLDPVPGTGTTSTTATTGTTGTTGTDCDPAIVYFEKDILPILNSNCAYSGCHDPGTAQEGVVLNNYDNVMRTGGIRPNDPGESELYEKITEDDPDDIMPPPPKQPLSSAQISLIEKWISQGAKNITCNNNGCDTVQVTYSKQVTQVISSFCAGCHSGGAPSGNILLTGYTNVKAVAQTGKLLCAVEHGAGCSSMPKGGTKLDDCRILMIRKWQEAGFPQ
jgi:hypothetical protein